MQLFFTQNISNNMAILEEEEARHVTQVLRRKMGDKMHLTDGLGNLYAGEIVDITKKTCLVAIHETHENYKKRPVHLHIAIAPTKNIDRFEWFLEKATEIGIDEITPLICKRSERTVIKPERLKGILISAMKQSVQTYAPLLNETLDCQKFLKNDFQTYKNKYIAYCNDATTHPLSKIYEKSENALILIGPEGDFTEAEVSLAFQNNFKGISLGQNRLRTETAGLVACHTIHLLVFIFSFIGITGMHAQKRHSRRAQEGGLTELGASFLKFAKTATRTGIIGGQVGYSHPIGDKNSFGAMAFYNSNTDQYSIKTNIITIQPEFRNYFSGEAFNGAYLAINGEYQNQKTIFTSNNVQTNNFGVGIGAGYNLGFTDRISGTAKASYDYILSNRNANSGSQSANQFIVSLGLGIRMP
jgi:16S rRNA (uracil1498-N3)-methyltransferase